MSDTPILAADSDSNMEEEDFPTSALSDPVWSKEPIPDRQLCIQMALDNSVTGLPTPLQGPNYESVSPEWEPMDDTDNDIQDLIAIPQYMFFSRLHITTFSLNYA